MSEISASSVPAIVAEAEKSVRGTELGDARDIFQGALFEWTDGYADSVDDLDNSPDVECRAMEEGIVALWMAYVDFEKKRRQYKRVVEVFTKATGDVVGQKLAPLWVAFAAFYQERGKIKRAQKVFVDATKKVRRADVDTIWGAFLTAMHQAGQSTLTMKQLRNAVETTTAGSGTESDGSSRSPDVDNEDEDHPVKKEDADAEPEPAPDRRRKRPSSATAAAPDAPPGNAGGPEGEGPKLKKPKTEDDAPPAAAGGTAAAADGDNPAENAKDGAIPRRSRTAAAPAAPAAASEAKGGEDAAPARVDAKLVSRESPRLFDRAVIHEDADLRTVLAPLGRREELTVQRCVRDLFRTRECRDAAVADVQALRASAELLDARARIAAAACEADAAAALAAAERDHAAKVVAVAAGPEREARRRELARARAELAAQWTEKREALDREEGVERQAFEGAARNVLATLRLAPFAGADGIGTAQRHARVRGGNKFVPQTSPEDLQLLAKEHMVLKFLLTKARQVAAAGPVGY